MYFFDEEQKGPQIVYVLIMSTQYVRKIDSFYLHRRGTLTAMTWHFPEYTSTSSTSRQKSENTPRSWWPTRTYAAGALCYRRQRCDSDVVMLFSCSASSCFLSCPEWGCSRHGSSQLEDPWQHQVLFPPVLYCCLYQHSPLPLFSTLILPTSSNLFTLPFTQSFH